MGNLAQWIIENRLQTNILINHAGIQLLTDLKQPLTCICRAPGFQRKFGYRKHFFRFGFCPNSIYAVYCATRAAIHSFTLSLRHHLNTQLSKFLKLFLLPWIRNCAAIIGKITPYHMVECRYRSLLKKPFRQWE